MIDALLTLLSSVESWLISYYSAAGVKVRAASSRSSIRIP